MKPPTGEEGRRYSSPCWFGVSTARYDHPIAERKGLNTKVRTVDRRTIACFWRSGTASYQQHRLENPPADEQANGRPRIRDTAPEDEATGAVGLPPAATLLSAGALSTLTRNRSGHGIGKIERGNSRTMRPAPQTKGNGDQQAKARHST
jgi:hypothetical protein